MLHGNYVKAKILLFFSILCWNYIVCLLVLPPEAPILESSKLEQKNFQNFSLKWQKLGIRIKDLVRYTIFNWRPNRHSLLVNNYLFQQYRDKHINCTVTLLVVRKCIHLSTICYTPYLVTVPKQYEVQQMRPVVSLCKASCPFLQAVNMQTNKQ